MYKVKGFRCRAQGGHRLVVIFKKFIGRVNNAIDSRPVHDEDPERSGREGVLFKGFR